MPRYIGLCLILFIGTGAGQSNHSSHQCRRRITYEEFRFIMAHSPCAMDLNDPVTRLKRDGDTDSSSHVYALQATIKDHRTIMDDHRTMINYLMNNTVNVTQFNQHFTDQHSRIGPIWKSWRDVSLILLIISNLCIVFSMIVIRLKPMELLTSFLLRRHQSKEQQQQQQVNVTQKKTRMIHGYPSEVELDDISNIDRNHLRY